MQRLMLKHHTEFSEVQRGLMDEVREKKSEPCVSPNAAREGARRGVIVRSIRSVGTENAGIKARVMEFAGSYLVTFGDDTLTIDDVEINPDAAGVDDPGRGLSFGNDLIVRVTYEYQFLFLSTIKIGPINLQSVSTMRME